MENNELNTTIAEAIPTKELLNEIARRLASMDARLKSVDTQKKSTDTAQDTCVKPIEELLGKQFWIPSYQRGYRWKADHVVALLDDIWEFINKTNKNYKEFYCLQPLVVKEVKEVDVGISDESRNDCWYEVIDGQQRLTTILLILKYLKIPSENEGIKDYIIEYQTREKSRGFLNKINEAASKKNIDYWHIYTAYKTIESWFVKKEETLESIRKEFAKSFLEDVKVIWYPVPENDNVIDVFTRLNIGKIRLTDAELIKSLFLNSSNYAALDSGAVRLKQLEIASEWDRIEYTLQQSDFWAFINNEPKHYSTRIEYIFDLISGNIGSGKKDLGTFAYYQAKFKKKKVDLSFVDKQWKEIKRYFQAFEDWFENELYYHKVGFLVNARTEIRVIKEKWDENDKVKFVCELNSLIAGKFTGKFTGKPLSEITYENTNVDKIGTILLLFNTETIIQMKNSWYKFPFDRYQNEKWHIEHIDSNTTNPINGKENQEKWLEIASKYIDLGEPLRRDINEYRENLKKYDYVPNDLQEKFEVLREEIVDLENASTEVAEDDKQGIGNLCLLDANTNQSYGNALFVGKRQVIAEKIKSGKFIPLCTQNVFLKLYTKDTASLLKWGHRDKKDYFDEIAKVLKNYIK